MGSEQEAETAIRELDGYQIGGRSLAVRVAEERARPGGGPAAARAARAAPEAPAAGSAAARATTWAAVRPRPAWPALGPRY